MKPRLHNYSITLLELLIALALVWVVVLAFFGIDIFSRYHVVTSDRRARVQNEASYVLEQMTKEIGRAIGNERVNGENSVVNTTGIAGDNAIRVYIDANNDSRRNDFWIAYRLNATQIWYCPNCNNSLCGTCNPAWGTQSNILSKQITNFTSTKPGGATLSDNYVEINLTACYYPDNTPFACGTPDNPNATMQTRIKMPAVSTN